MPGTAVILAEKTMAHHPSFAEAPDGGERGIRRPVIPLSITFLERFSGASAKIRDTFSLS